MTIWWHSGNCTLEFRCALLLPFSFRFLSFLLCQDLFCISFSWCIILRVYFTLVHHSLNFKHSVTLPVENPYFLRYRVFSSCNSSLILVTFCYYCTTWKAKSLNASLNNGLVCEIGSFVFFCFTAWIWGWH